VPRLILLNGPPGCGKSTLAQMFAHEHPLTLNLDIDRLRAQIGQWRARSQESGLLARQLALAMAGIHLASGHDVVIPQYVARIEFIEQVEAVATGAGAPFHEIVLLDSRENSSRRFERRGRTAADPAHVQAHEMIDEAGGRAAFAEMYEQLLMMLAARPRARIVRTRNGQVARAYQDFLSRLG
jgi:predicted kinase